MGCFKKDYVKPEEVKVNATKKTDADKRKDRDALEKTAAQQS